MNIKQVLKTVWFNEGPEWRYVPQAYSDRGPGWGVFDRKEKQFVEDRKLLGINPSERILQS